LSAATGKPVVVRRALRERHFDDFIGTNCERLDSRIHPPSGETMMGFIDRSLTGVAEMLVPGAMPLLISHGGVLRVLCGALDVDLSVELTANALPPALERSNPGWRVVPFVAARSPAAGAGRRVAPQYQEFHM
jgi:broad specificity phosphatase PhoE